MKKKIAINGFGRIGRIVTKILIEKYSNECEIVAINDLTDANTLTHLFTFDSTYGKFSGNINNSKSNIKINNNNIPIFSEKSPKLLPWGKLNVDIVLECTGVFRTKELLQQHIEAGAKKVILSAPAKDVIDATIVLGVNEHIYNKDKHNIISNASCTTNCLAPVTKILNDEFKIKHGLITTTHSFTGDQRILDAPHSDLRRSRTASGSIIPTTTGAAKAVGLVIPELQGKLNGIALRVPTETVSVVDLVVQLEKDPSTEEINNKFIEYSQKEFKNILGAESRPLVSVDYKGDSRSSIIDLSLTMKIEKGFVKILSWYDNEYGYASRLADLTIYI
jgi:glyceraldehyde 3-phosphate dehydrogenase